MSIPRLLRYTRLLVALAVLTVLFSTSAWANVAPIADAGPDQNIYLGDVAVLDGSGTDDDGDPIEGWWWTMQTKPQGSLAQLNAIDAANPSFVPDIVGDYILTLMVSDGQLWSDPSGVIIHVSENLPPTAVISADATTGPAPLTVHFDATQSSDPEGRPLSYHWAFSDGPISESAVTSRVFTSPGTFMVVLWVTDDRGQTDRDSLLIEVTSPLPVANAGPDQAVFLGPTVALDGTASSYPAYPYVLLNYAWTMDARPTGSNAILSNANTATPFFTPDMTGQYVISLVVSDANDPTSASVADTVLINVSQNLPPVATASADITSGTAPLTVNFDASASYDVDSPALTYSWDFGDPGSPANTATGSAASHTYESSGPYTAIVTVTDDYNNIDMASVAINVTTPNMPPAAAPNANPVSGPAPLEVRFTANAIDPNPGDTLAWHWDFGDNTTSTDENPLHTYSSAGTYTATLTVSDGSLSTSASMTVTVSSPLIINVTEAKVDFGKEGKVDGKINLKADFTFAGALNPSDTIKVVFDGLTLVEAPFASFKAEDDEPGEYEYKEKNLLVKIDLTESAMKVSRHKIVLTGVDNSNGIDVVISFGAATGADHMTMEEKEEGHSEKKGERELRYKEK